MEYGKPTEEKVKKDSFLVINCRRGNFTVYASGILIRPISRSMRATEYFAWSTCFAMEDTKDKVKVLIFLCFS
jgi:hypothetical protein